MTIPETVSPDGLRERAKILLGYMDESCARHLELAADEIERMSLALKRIDAINDNPACFSKEINDLCDPILRPHLNR